MRIPTTPPSARDLIDKIISGPDGPKRFLRISQMQIGPAPGGKYRHWDVVKHLPPPNGITPEEWWLGIKLARQHLHQELPILNKSGEPFRYATPDVVFRLLHQIDTDAAGAIRGPEQLTNPDTRETYLIKSLFEESITSSQLEGAATTREVARDMLRQRRLPKDRSEQMIYNNYVAMQFIRDFGSTDLTTGTILELQRLLTQDTLDDQDAAGRFRKSTELIQVVDQTSGDVLHVPPKAEQLPERVERICHFANDTESDPFIHPVIRSVLLHFQMGYDHPFVDGNGRTARALFYWSMQRRGYWVAEYVSISRILTHAPAQYARSYLYTETDENDATYFIIDQLRVLIRAIMSLHQYLARKGEELARTREKLQQSEALRTALNHRQLAVVNHALKNPLFVYTIESHRGSHNVAYQTARTDLMELAKLGLVEQGKVGRAFRFTAPSDLHERIRLMR